MGEHEEAQPAPEATIQVGGAVLWFSISLSITADTLDPDEVTHLLGVEPDETWQRGAPRKRGLTSQHGAWFIRLRREQTSEPDVGEAIKLLLDRVPASAEAWDQVRVKADIRIFAGLRLDAFNQGFRLSDDLMRRLGRLGLTLDCDIYVVESKANENPAPAFL